ncbi:MAG: ABC transporter ATP-binding protein, partial [Actinomycetota bacterium]
MITRLIRVCDDHGTALRRCAAGWVVAGVLQGVGFVLLVPVLRVLINGDTASDRNWVIGMFVAFAAYATVRHAAQMASYRAAVQLSRGLFDRLGDKVAQLPTRSWSNHPSGS